MTLQCWEMSDGINCYHQWHGGKENASQSKLLGNLLHSLNTILNPVMDGPPASTIRYEIATFSPSFSLHIQAL